MAKTSSQPVKVNVVKTTKTPGTTEALRRATQRSNSK
jgi:hypothetical protein